MRLRILVLVALGFIARPIAAQATPVSYSFDMFLIATTVTGTFVIDSASPRYVGGGTTTRIDLLDYTFNFSRGADSFVGSPSNELASRFDMTYSTDLSSVTRWDFAFSFQNPSGSGFVSFMANNTWDGGFGFDLGAAAVSDNRPGGTLSSPFLIPPPHLIAAIQPSSVAEPGTLALLAIGVLGLCLSNRQLFIAQRNAPGPSRGITDTNSDAAGES